MEHDDAYDAAQARIEAWFAARSWQPFAFQREVWQAFRAGESGLIHASTGTGKTYAAWLGPVAAALAAGPRAGIQVLWLTPLRALAADTAAALRAPLADLGLPWEVELRTGDTSQATRAKQRRNPPAALITTPESLSLLLSYEDAAARFGTLQAVIVDEWHELLSSRRGTQTELCLARLRALAPGLRTWGLSATLGNLDLALAALVGADPRVPARLVRGAVPREIAVETLLPETVERFPWAGHLGLRMLPQVLDVIYRSASTLVFTGTRAQTEIWYQALLEAAPDLVGQIALHHGSLEREQREWVEHAVRDGRLRAVVCTSSLDLGVDFAPVDTVVQIGSPHGIARLVQRAGRSGHRPGVASQLFCTPTNTLELVEFAAVRDAVAAGTIEPRAPLDRPLDVLVQHLVTVALGGGFAPDAMRAEVRDTWSFRVLTDDEWLWALDFIRRGGQALRAYEDYQRVVEVDGRYTVTDPRIARRHRASIGTIVSDASIRVQFVRGGSLGMVDEGYVARLAPGDKFVFAGHVLEFIRVRDMICHVRAAKGDATVPRWGGGGRMAMSSQLARAVRARLHDARQGIFDGPEMLAVRGLLDVQRRWSRIPAEDELLIERFTTREGHHIALYPFAGRHAHEGLAAVLALRLSRRKPISFTIAVNDYGLELLAPVRAPIEDEPEEWYRLLDAVDLETDLAASLNAGELARRRFREIARVAGLVYQGYPGEKNAKQLQMSSSLIYDVFRQYDPANPLLALAQREVLSLQLDAGRIAAALNQITVGQIVITQPPRPTPLAFPLFVDRLRDTITSEKLADRVRRMQLALEKAAG